MQAALGHQTNSEPPEAARGNTSLSAATTGSGASIVIQAQLADFDVLAASAPVFRSLRAYVHEYPGELTAQLGDLQRQQPSIKSRREDLPSSAPSVKTLIFSVNFDHFQSERDSEQRGEEVSFAA